MGLARSLVSLYITSFLGSLASPSLIYRIFHILRMTSANCLPLVTLCSADGMVMAYYRQNTFNLDSISIFSGDLLNQHYVLEFELLRSFINYLSNAESSVFAAHVVRPIYQSITQDPSPPF